MIARWSTSVLVLYSTCTLGSLIIDSIKTADFARLFDQVAIYMIIQQSGKGAGCLWHLAPRDCAISRSEMPQCSMNNQGKPGPTGSSPRESSSRGPSKPTIKINDLYRHSGSRSWSLSLYICYTLLRRRENSPSVVIKPSEINVDGSGTAAALC